MTVELIREISKLGRRVNTRYSSLIDRVTQLELNQAALSQVTSIVVLIESLNAGLNYDPNPHSFTPLYVMPPMST